jgi:hypothetical protein
MQRQELTSQNSFTSKGRIEVELGKSTSAGEFCRHLQAVLLKFHLDTII